MPILGKLQDPSGILPTEHTHSNDVEWGFAENRSHLWVRRYADIVVGDVFRGNLRNAI